MKKSGLFLIIMLLLTLSLGLVGAVPAHAQGELEELDTTLARAAARGFLVGLTRPALAQLVDFYMLASLDRNTVLAELQGVTGYEITGGDWVSDVTYQTKAILQPDNREISVYTGKYDGRWQVEAVMTVCCR